LNFFVFKASALTVRQRKKSKSAPELSAVKKVEDQREKSEELQKNEISLVLSPNENNVVSATVHPVRNLKGKLLKKAGVLVFFVILFVCALFTKDLNKLPAHLYNQTNITSSIIIH
jgi:hypothetical protein